MDSLDNYAQKFATVIGKTPDVSNSILIDFSGSNLNIHYQTLSKGEVKRSIPFEITWIQIMIEFSILDLAMQKMCKESVPSYC